MTTVLVTGASGYIGNAVVRELLASGCRVIAVTSKRHPPGFGSHGDSGLEQGRVWSPLKSPELDVTTAVHPNGASASQNLKLDSVDAFSKDSESSAVSVGRNSGQLFWQTCDLLSPADVHDFFENRLLQIDGARPTHLFHGAWHVAHGDFWTSPMNHKWVDASKGLIEAFIKFGGQRVVGVGSCAEYAWSGAPLAVNSPLEPATLYGQSKLKAFLTLRDLAKQAGVSWSWGRVFYNFGPGESTQKLIPSAIRALKAGETFTCKNSSQICDYLHVGDVANQLVQGLLSQSNGPFNVASGCGVSNRELLLAVAEQVAAVKHLELLEPAHATPTVVAAPQNPSIDQSFILKRLREYVRIGK
jgi:nucleoside-diphosphate-sugar epimerase